MILLFLYEQWHLSSNIVWFSIIVWLFYLVCSLCPRGLALLSRKLHNSVYCWPLVLMSLSKRRIRTRDRRTLRQKTRTQTRLTQSSGVDIVGYSTMETEDFWDYAILRRLCHIMHIFVCCIFWDVYMILSLGCMCLYLYTHTHTFVWKLVLKSLCIFH